jgi:hypothetical protein
MGKLTGHTTILCKFEEGLGHKLKQPLDRRLHIFPLNNPMVSKLNSLTNLGINLR